MRVEADVSSAVEWSLLQGGDLFAIDQTGAITYVSTATVDFGITTSYTIVVAATASENDAVSSSLTLTIAVVDVLERIDISDTNENANTIVENAESGTAVLGVDLQVRDENGTDLLLETDFSLLQGSTQFAISTIGVITYAATAATDYEMTSSYTIVVMGTVSRGGVTASNDLTLTIAVVDILERVDISDTNENANTIVENAGSGTAVLGVDLQAVDEGGEPLQSGVIWKYHANRCVCNRRSRGDHLCRNCYRSRL